MRKTAISLTALLLLAFGAYAQTHRDGGDNDLPGGIDLLSVGIGLVVGLVVGYLLGNRRKSV